MVNNNYLLIIVIILMAYFLASTPKTKKIKLKELKKGNKKNSHGIIFGKLKNKYIFSSETDEGHIGVFSSSGTGKTSSIGIPTLKKWTGTSYTIDISGDVCKNCPNMPNKLVCDLESKQQTIPYNIFGIIDNLILQEEKEEALEKLAFLLMPEDINASDSGRYYQSNGRKILTAAFISFYFQGLDFIEICEKIMSNSWKNLFVAIDETENKKGMMLISSFQGASETNTAGCKQACDDVIKLFATNERIKSIIRRPKENEDCIEPGKIEIHNIFIIIGEDKLDLYSPFLNIITSQIMQYIGTRQVNEHSPTILLFLDEFASLKISEELILSGVRRFRKKKM